MLLEVAIDGQELRKRRGIVVDIGIDAARYGAYRVVVRLEPAIEGECRVAIAVVLVALTGEIGTVGVETTDADPVMPAPIVAGDVGGEQARIVAAAFNSECSPMRARRRARIEIDDTRDGIAAPQRALRTAGNFDTFDAVDGKVGEIDVGPGRWVIDLDTVHEHEHVVGFRAAHTQLGERADAPGARDVDARGTA